MTRCCAAASAAASPCARASHSAAFSRRYSSRVCWAAISASMRSAPQQRVALLGRGFVPAAAVSLVGAHVLDAHAERAHAGQRLEHVEVLRSVPAVPAALVPGDRANQPDLLVIAQRRLTQPAAPRHVPDRQSCHAGSKTHLKRLKSNAGGQQARSGCSGPWRSRPTSGTRTCCGVTWVRDHRAAAVAAPRRRPPGHGGRGVPGACRRVLERQAVEVTDVAEPTTPPRAWPPR